MHDATVPTYRSTQLAAKHPQDQSCHDHLNTHALGTNTGMTHHLTPHPTSTCTPSPFHLQHAHNHTTKTPAASHNPLHLPVLQRAFLNFMLPHPKTPISHKSPKR
ncbi:hypothetical protein E2C01_014181 [Portunus trituberculatus]|uniref:Uncharacterized protein n=1 Tax=Portunus trituberculatus TaxID=210409 RepID=A0A5B7DJ69_PORTR|nr:hypothetical protein [Portunus trituberculatus]